MALTLSRRRTLRGCKVSVVSDGTDIDGQDRQDGGIAIQGTDDDESLALSTSPHPSLPSSKGKGYLSSSLFRGLTACTEQIICSLTADVYEACGCLSCQVDSLRNNMYGHEKESFVV